MVKNSLVRMQFEFPPAICQQLDQLAAQLAEREKPVSQFEWMQSPAGKAAWRQVLTSNQQGKKSLDQMNSELKQAYLAATGARRTGRPRIAQFRAKVLEAALASYVAQSGE